MNCTLVNKKKTDPREPHYSIVCSIILFEKKIRYQMNYIRGNDYIVWFVMSLFVFFQFHELGGVYKGTKQFLDHVTFAE